MQAVVDLNGKQYQVQEGRYLLVDRLSNDVDDVIQIDKILMIADGEDSLVGAPYVDGATIRAKVVSHDRGAKVLVYKMRCKKGYRRKNGHRQDYTRLQIEVLDFPGKKEKPAQTATVEAPAKESKKTAKADKAAEPKKATKKADSKAAEPKAKAKAPAAEKAVDVAEAKAAEQSTAASEQASGEE